MKAVILAGGFGTRISEESATKPKPMVEIGGKPILWHIMKIFASYGVCDFVICCGYKGFIIKEYFANYFLHQSDVTFDLRNNQMQVHQNSTEPWKVTLVDTGLNTMTGGRLKRVRPYLDGEETFCFTYGDGVGDVNLSELIAFHKKEGRLATVTGVRPPARFGALEVNDTQVVGFEEKPLHLEGWINGGFFVLSPKVIDHISGDQTVWEGEPMQRLALDGQLSVFKHTGFWAAMDTVRDRNHLEQLWSSGTAPWKRW